MMPRTRHLGRLRAACCVCVLVALGTPTEAADGGWSYHVAFEPARDRVVVTVRTQQVAIPSWGFADPGAMRTVRLPPGSPYHIDGRRRLRAKAPTSQPLTYAVSLSAMLQRARGTEDAARVGRDWVTRPGLLLVQPERWPPGASVTATFRLPPGHHVAVAWPPAHDGGGSFQLRDGSLGRQERMALGRWTPEVFDVDGTQVHVAVLDGPHRISAAGRRAWLSRAVRTVADLFGQFPHQRIQVIAQPMTPDRGRPVVFGRASMGGGSLVHVMMSGTAPDAAFPGEWLTIHEMTHLGMPWTPPRARWLGEGVVSYYQEILRARSGILHERQAWQNLHNWFARGRASGGRRPLSVESATMTNRYAYHRVYWGGAALTLLMDVALRRGTGGTRTFDDVVRMWSRMHAKAPRTYSDDELLRAADAWLGRPTLLPLVTPYLRGTSFPDLRATYAWLGIEVRGKTVTLRNEAPGSAMRRAITRAGGR